MPILISLPGKTEALLREVSIRAGWILEGMLIAVFLGCIISPPSLMDDVDAVQAQIARNMLDSGDWVTARLDGIPYLEKSPLKYWLIAVCFKIFGVHDWVARLPVSLSAILLCWLTYRIGKWAFSELAGLYAGLILATCIGLFLFTRIQIPDVTITATIAGAISMLAQFGMFFGGGHRDNNGGLGLFGSLALMILAPIAAMIVQMAISRTREYAADRGGAEISGRPEALASALAKIERAAYAIPNEVAERNPATAHLFIVNPLVGGGLLRLFSTHPPIRDRIRRLEQMASRGSSPEYRPPQPSPLAPDLWW